MTLSGKIGLYRNFIYWLLFTLPCQMRIFHPRRYWRRIKELYHIHCCRRDNVALPYILLKTESHKGLMATHVSAFSLANVGDTLLPVVLRDLFNQHIPIKRWHGENIHQMVTSKEVYFYNKDNFIVIGGGGLFLRDTHPNDVSGWQWNCSIDQLKKIRKPIIAFAIGYNRFRGQEDFKPIFTEHINTFVEKAVFIGLRNHGSMEKIKTYLKSDALRNKLVFQPCMTTLISKIYPNLSNYIKKEDYIAFNCAFDRQQLRSVDEDILNSIAKTALALSKVTSIRYFSHMPSDNKILPYFEKHNVPYKLVEMKTLDSIIHHYSQPRLVIGMRGHAQMIPFGCLTPIVSIISHDKMQWFLDDIHHPEWGVDVLDDDFEANLHTKAVTAYNDYMGRIQDITVEQEKLWEITQKNLQTIKSSLRKQ